jgi:hypothetical protein
MQEFSNQDLSNTIFQSAYDEGVLDVEGRNRKEVIG